MRIILSFATEVAHLPRDYDHIKEMAEFLTAEGLVGNFHLTGDYARALKRAGRRDVVDALGKHEIGFHCNHHGASPFMGTYMEERDWHGAVAEWLLNELPGVAVVEELFQRRPTYYTTEFAKAPQTVHASWLGGMPMTGYLLLPTRGQGAVWYCNSFVPNSENLCGVEWPSRTERDAEEVFREQFHRFEKKIDGGETDLLRVIQHSYKVYGTPPFVMPEPTPYQDDTHHYEDGGLPRTSLPEDVIRPRVDAIKRSLRYYAERAAFVTFAQYRRGFHDSAGHWVALDELDRICAFLRDRLDAYVRGPLSASPAEVFGMLVRVLRTFHEDGAAPDRVYMRNLIGPTARIPHGTADAAVRTQAVLGALRTIDRKLDDALAMPAAVELDGRAFGPGQTLRGLCELYVSMRSGKVPDTVHMVGPNLPAIADEPFFAEETFTRPIYTNGFEGRNICVMCRLQSWSWKPAVRVT